MLPKRQVAGAPSDSNMQSVRYENACHKHLTIFHGVTLFH